MTDTSKQTEARCRTAWPKDALRIAFGIIWLIDATLKWLPGFAAYGGRLGLKGDLARLKRLAESAQANPVPL